MGDAVLDMSEVKVARVIEDAEPALRLLLRETRGRGRVVHIRTESPTEAYTWMAELDGRPGPVFGTPLAGFPDGAESGGPGCARRGHSSCSDSGLCCGSGAWGRSLTRRLSRYSKKVAPVT